MSLAIQVAIASYLVAALRAVHYFWGSDLQAAHAHVKHLRSLSPPPPPEVFHIRRAPRRGPDHSGKKRGAVCWADLRALMDRSDSKFDALPARSNELSRQKAEVTERVARNEAILETVQADRCRASAKSASRCSSNFHQQPLIGWNPHLPPPAPQRPHGEFGRVMVHAHADPAGVRGHISDSVRKSLAQS